MHLQKVIYRQINTLEMRKNYIDFIYRKAQA